MVVFGFGFFVDSGDFCSRIHRAAQSTSRRADCRAFDDFGQGVSCFCNNTFRLVIYCFFFEEELLAADDLAVDFVDADLADLLDDAVFEPAPEDLLDAAFEPEPDDLPADDFDAPPVDLLAVDFPAEDDLPADDFDAVFEPEDLLADVDFDADALAVGLAEADLLPLAEDDLLAVVLLLVVADSPEFFFVVAIAISLKFF